MPGPKGTIEYLLSDEDNLRNQPAGTQEWLEQQQAQAQSHRPATSSTMQPASQEEKNEQKFGLDPKPAVIPQQQAETKDKAVIAGDPAHGLDLSKARSTADLRRIAENIVRKGNVARDKDIEDRRKKELKWIALNDGISALSNLLFTSLGAPNAYDPKNNMSDRFKARYDELYKANESKDRQAINDLVQGYLFDYQQKLKQKQQDAADARQAALDAAAEKRWKQEFEQRNRFHANEQARLTARDKQELEIKQMNAFANQVRADASKIRAVYLGSKGKAKYTTLTDPDTGESFVINDAYWTNGDTVQSLFDRLVADGVGRGPNEGDAMYKRRMNDINTTQKKVDFVKQNWHKSALGRQTVAMMSQRDPAASISPADNEEDGGLHWGEKSEEKKEDDRPVIIWHE